MKCFLRFSYITNYAPRYYMFGKIVSGFPCTSRVSEHSLLCMCCLNDDDRALAYILGLLQFLTLFALWLNKPIFSNPRTYMHTLYLCNIRHIATALHSLVVGGSWSRNEGGKRVESGNFRGEAIHHSYSTTMETKNRWSVGFYKFMSDYLLHRLQNIEYMPLFSTPVIIK